MVLAALACGPADTAHSETQAAPPGARLDKRALYADASMLPTRAGEQARRELALAGQLASAIEQLELSPLQIDVRLDQPTSVIVIAAPAHPRDEASRAADTRDIRELAQAMLPALEPDAVHVWLRAPALEPAPPEAPPTAPPWALALACLGFGLSLGVTLERLRVRQAVRMS